MRWTRLQYKTACWKNVPKPAYNDVLLLHDWGISYNKKWKIIYKQNFNRKQNYRGIQKLSISIAVVHFLFFCVCFVHKKDVKNIKFLIITPTFHESVRWMPHGRQAISISEFTY